MNCIRGRDKDALSPKQAKVSQTGIIKADPPLNWTTALDQRPYAVRVPSAILTWTGSSHQPR